MNIIAKKRKLKYKISWDPSHYFEVRYANTLEGAKKVAFNPLYVAPSNIKAIIQERKADKKGYKAHSSYQYRQNRKTNRYRLVKL